MIRQVDKSLLESRPLQARRPGGHRRWRAARHSRLHQSDPRAPDRGGRRLGESLECQTADFEELLAVLDLNRVADDTFVGSHPSKNPVRTFGGQMMAQSFVAGSRTVLGEAAAERVLGALHRGRRPREGPGVPRGAAARRTPVRQPPCRRDAGRPAADHGDDLLPVRRTRASSTASNRPSCPTPSRCRPSTNCCAGTRTSSRISSTRYGRSTGATPTIRPG